MSKFSGDISSFRGDNTSLAHQTLSISDVQFPLHLCRKFCCLLSVVVVIQEGTINVSSQEVRGAASSCVVLLMQYESASWDLEQGVGVEGYLTYWIRKGLMEFESEWGKWEGPFAKQ